MLLKRTRALRGALKEIEALLAENTCDVCAGTGEPESGGDCICAGSGKMSVAAIHLRELAITNSATAQAEISRLKATIQRLEAIAERSGHRQWADTSEELFSRGRRLINGRK